MVATDHDVVEAEAPCWFTENSKEIYQNKKMHAWVYRACINNCFCSLNMQINDVLYKVAVIISLAHFIPRQLTGKAEFGFSLLPSDSTICMTRNFVLDSQKGTM